MSAEQRQARQLSPSMTSALVCAWLVAALAGFAFLSAYANEPGPTGAPSATWPAATTVPRTTGRATLLIFAHPQCPCTRASMGELARLMAQAHERLTTHVLIYRPANEPAEWAHGAIWDAATAIPGVHVARDDNGRESSRFGVAVSGHSLLYDSNGRLMFSGGITGARGHEGDNAGRAAIVALLTTGTAPVARTPVFGCFIRPAD